MNALLRFAIAIAVLAAPGLAPAADPVAFLSDLKGDVILDGQSKPVFLSELLPGSKLSLAKDATAAVMYVVSGNEFSLKGPGDFLVGKAAVNAAKGAAPVKRVSSLRANPAILVQTSRSATASLRMRGLPAGPNPEKARGGPIYPVNAKVSTFQPTMRWSGEAKEAGFTVVIASLDGKEVFRGHSRSTALKLPVKLAPGVRYAWTVSAGDERLGEALFETMPVSAMQSADKARGAARNFSDRVLVAMYLQDLGATHDARELWAELARERPDSPEIAALAR
jgi:hypothetical protein